MANRKNSTRRKSVRVTPITPGLPPESAPVTIRSPAMVKILDKADDVRRGLHSLGNAVEGGLVDADTASALNWMLDHLAREHAELMGMLKTTHAGKAVAYV